MKRKLNLTNLSQKELKIIKAGEPVCSCRCDGDPTSLLNLANVLTSNDL
jgi:hypothetical protein